MEAKQSMNRYKATAILVVVTIGYFISYPFHETLIGGLLTSIFGASMIGGFADWYGITAIFRKPLGIPFKTNVIPRNRESIFDALSKMVSEEILTREYLKSFLWKHDLSKLLLEYLQICKKDKRMRIGISAMILDFLNGINANETSHIAAKTIIHNLPQMKISSIILATAELSIKRGYSDKIINFIIDQIVHVIKARDFYVVILELVEKVKSTYERGSKRKAFINSVVLDSLLKLSSDSMALTIQNRIGDYLNAFKETSNEDRLRFEEWSYKKLYTFKNNPYLQEKVDLWIVGQLNSTEIGDYIASFLQSLKDERLRDKGSIKMLAEEVETVIEGFIVRFQSSPELQRGANERLNKILSNLIDSIHENISIMIKDNLIKYSDKDVVELIESKIGDDLQLVRINGSLVGGIVGMTIFLLTYLIM
jgi:uncharacterized membrane-anchored protein YjiN (DUF445 family)